MRILLADDQRALPSAMRLWLEHLDNFILVGSVTDVPSLLRTVETLQPDILLLDWELPGFTESEERQRILQQLHTHHPNLHIVVLSTNPVSRQEALTPDVNVFVSKSETPDYLAQALRQFHQIIDESK